MGASRLETITENGSFTHLEGADVTDKLSVAYAIQWTTRTRLGRYMIRCPIVLERLKWDEERREVVYTAHPRKTGGPYGSEARWPGRPRTT